MKTKPPAATPYQPTPVEIAAVSAQNARRRARVNVPRLKRVKAKGGKTQLAPDHPDSVVWRTAFEQTFGTGDYDAAKLLMDSAVGVASPNPEAADPMAINAVLGLIHGVNPQDEIEAMLASQMVGLHLSSMGCLQRAHLSGQTFEGREMNLKHAGKLSRAFAAQVEALNRHRGKGQRKVTVEHVNVHPGGQAIVGNVQGGGVTPKNEEQSHALGYAAGTEMPCEIEAERATVPGTGSKGA